jgi:coenzyme F420-0:L-glutamate ligase
MEDRDLILHAIYTKIIEPRENAIDVILQSIEKQKLELEDDDVLAVTSKIVAYAQGRIMKLSDIKPSQKAREIAPKYSMAPEFAELILQEADKIYGGVEKAILTLKSSVLTANAGIDNKNAPTGQVILWPNNIKEWTRSARDEVKAKTGRRVAVLIVDSGLMPLRIGTTGLALAVAGFKPIRDTRGDKDLYGKPLTITRHAVADDLASAAHLLMGEAAEKTPAVLVKDAPVDFDDSVYDGTDMMMPIRECIFMGTFIANYRS